MFDETEEAFVIEGPDIPGKMVLALNKIRGRQNIYAGTVPAKVIKKRRIKNKMAKKSRRNNR